MRVGELARRTGVGVSTLRAWERRFGFLEPRRSGSGQRLYSEDDVERVAAVCRLVAEGLTLPTAIARVTSAGSGARVVGEGEALLLRQVLQAVDQGIWVSEAARTRYANRRMAELMGCTLDELYERSVLDFIDPEELEAVKEYGRKGMAGQRQQLEVRMRRADGSTFLAGASTTPLQASKGGYEGSVAVVSDITARKQEESDARFRDALLDAIGEAVIATDPDGTIVYVNPAAEQLFGWRATELLGQNGLEILPSPNATRSSRQIHSRLLARDHFSGELDLIRRDGSQFAALVTGAPVLDGGGELLGLIAVLTDSSDRQRLEHEVRSQEQQAEMVALLGERALRCGPGGLEPLLAETVEVTRRALGCTNAGLLELAPGSEDFELRAAYPRFDERLTVPAGSRSFTGFCALAGKVVIVDDTRSERRFDMHPSAGRFGILSAIATPVSGAAGLYGVLTAGDTAPRKFGASSTHFMQSMANILGVALRNAL